MKKKFPGAGHTTYLESSIKRIEPAARNKSGDEEAAVYEISASSDAEVTVRMFGMKWRQKISHARGAGDLRRFKSGRAPLLFNHDPDKLLGVILDAAIERDADGGTLRTQVRFGPSALAQEKKAEVDAEVLMGSSIGINPIDWKMAEEDEENGDLWEITKWEALELSLATIPRNTQVGVGLNVGGPTSGPALDPNKEERTMLLRNQAEGGGVAATPPAAATPPPVAATSGFVSVTNETPKPAGLNPAQIEELFGMARAHNMNDQVQGWIMNGLTPQQAAYEIAKKKTVVAVGQPGAESLSEGLSDEDLGRYSYARAIELAGRRAEGRERNFDGVEGEWHNKLLKRGFVAKNNGILVPTRLFDQPKHLADRYVMGTGTPHAGAELVRQDRGEMIDILRNQTFVIRRGAQVLTGVTARMSWMKDTGDPVIYWRGENPATPVTQTDPALDEINSVEKTLSGSVKVPRQLPQISTVDVESWLRNKLGAGHALAIDRGAITGTGAENQPLGIVNTPGVQDYEIADNTGKVVRSDLTSMLVKVAKKNATFGALGWMMTIDIAGVLMDRLESDVAGARYMWEGSFEDGRLRNYGANATNQMPENLGPDENWHGIIFGKWDSLIVLMYGALEYVVDPYTMAGYGQWVITSFQMADVINQYPEAFVVARGAKPV